MPYRRPSISEPIARQLRKEAGFGCVRCGHPYIEYHHIKPWREEHHFRPEDMVAVCGNCHGFFETQGGDRQYQLKSSPKNVREGEFRGLLEYDKRSLVFRVGSNWYENIPVILQYRSTPLISCYLKDGQALISINVFNSSGRLVLKVQDSEVVFRLGDMWDFECKRNIAIARSGPRDIVLKMDFSQQDATVEGCLWAGGRQVKLGREYTNIGSMMIKDGYFGSESNFAKGVVGIQIG